MSTIKSSAENLTLNADGANNDIIFQSNGSNVATLDQAGLLTATTFAGSGASLTSLPNGLQLDHSGTKKIEATADGVLLPAGADITINAGGGSGGLTLTNGSGTTKLELGGGSGGQNLKFSVASNTASYFTFHSNTGEQVRIADAGVGIGVTPDRRLKVKGAASTNVAMFEHNDANGCIMDCRYDATSTPTDGAIFVRFGDASSNNGSITSTGSGTTVAYNTSSDYRLKENVDYTWDATTRLKQLKPARFNFIANAGTTVDGFLAHEVSNIVPTAVTGEKDAMTAEVLYVEGDELPEGKSIGDVKEASVIDPQGIDQSKLVPLLVKTIQELEARITALEA